MAQDIDYEAVAYFLEKGGPVAANVATCRAQECLSAINADTGELRERFQDLVTLSDDPEAFDPYKHFWGMHDDFHSIPPFEKWDDTKEIEPAQLVAKKPCFTWLSSESTPVHDKGYDIFIGYQKDISQNKQWRRVLHVRHKNAVYKDAHWPSNNRQLASMSFGLETVPLERLSEICPQAVADVNRAFREAESATVVRDFNETEAV